MLCRGRLPVSCSLRSHSHRQSAGFTLIELTVALVIAGILATVGMKSLGAIAQTAKVEETKAELDQLAVAIAGNPTLQSGGVRSDFGYVGDVGALPANLSALVTNPGSYATWNGPYIHNGFTEDAADYSTDAWGNSYALNSTSISSTGNGSAITRRFAAASSELLLNSIAGVVYDSSGTPPGTTYDDSLAIRIIIPNGSGNTVTKTKTVDPSGYFRFDSIPIGSHQLLAIQTSRNDTLTRRIAVTPGSTTTLTLYFRTDRF